MLLLSAKPELIFKPGPDDVWTTVTVWAVASFMGIACLFLIGQWIARRSQGRELAACLAFLLFERVFWAALTILIGAGYGDTLPGWTEKAASLLLTALGIVALFAGVHRTRRAVATVQPPAAV
jgi:membrane protein DedA with SNARE-associated domain